LLKSTFEGFVTKVLGLKEESEGNDQVLDHVMQMLIEMRNKARAEKDWATSDLIRNRLSEMNITLKDNKDGETTYEIG
jgi:cysteinyl-tRNA synthetase